MDDKRKALIEEYFACMRSGASRVEELIGLFAEDAEYTEPFAPDGPTTHKGREAIARMLRAGVEQRPPDLRLEIHRIDVRADAILAEWTCHAEAFGGAIDGRDRFETRDGQIQTLVTELVPREHGAA